MKYKNEHGRRIHTENYEGRDKFRKYNIANNARIVLPGERHSYGNESSMLKLAHEDPLTTSFHTLLKNKSNPNYFRAKKIRGIFMV